MCMSHATNLRVSSVQGILVKGDLYILRINSYTTPCLKEFYLLLITSQQDRR
ncbi:hypothetical protein L873DRAFT_1822192 [Choiromyces venosus 120613-1]|uniref:Uncharacterized protein n=1 Tax=Choiromyces venosus 120613-1 TaxID=1336337 RepID=A0A3N4IZS2_9PEZI|nr:hypothetical protein L873DRAFT_1822192 [Choiromyces venosus 120613-1]